MPEKFSDLRDGECFSRRGRVRKRVDSGTEATVGADGRVRRRKVRGDPEVRRVACSLRFLGVGLPGMSGHVLELGRRGRRPCR